MTANQTKKLKKKNFSQHYNRLSNRDFRRPRAIDKETKVNLDFIVKKLKGAKKVLYKLDVPLEDDKQDDPERQARREEFLRKRKQFYTDFKKVQQAKCLLQEEELRGLDADPSCDINCAYQY